MFELSTFSLLELPVELRAQIYSELLCPIISEAITLYHYPWGRPKSLNIHTNILLTNKQIYKEALAVLYSNTYRIDLTFPAHSYDRPPIPYRHVAPDFFISPEVQYLDSTRDWCFTKEGKLESTKGKIYPYVFRRLRHIEIKTADVALWADSKWGPYWSRCGRMFIELVRCVSEVQDKDVEDTGRMVKTLVLNMNTTPDGCKVLRLVNDREKEELLGELKAVLPLLRFAEKQRTVTGKAQLLGKNGNKLGDMDIEEWVSGLKSTPCL